MCWKGSGFYTSLNRGEETWWKLPFPLGSAGRIQASVWLERCWALDAFSRLKPRQEEKMNAKKRDKNRQEQSELNATWTFLSFAIRKLMWLPWFLLVVFVFFQTAWFLGSTQNPSNLWNGARSGVSTLVLFLQEPNNLYLRSHNPNWCFP